MENLIEFDKWLFLLFNGLHNPGLDDLMSSISSRFVWIPLYAILLYVVIRTFKVQSVYIILAVVLLIALSDQLSVHLFKNVFQRLRPCHDPVLRDMVHLVNNHCGGQFGFISSHATNVFGLAYFMGKVLKKHSIFWFPALFFWAFVVSYSRIYLGVHYPLDLIAGGLFGILMARLVLLLLNYTDSRFSLKIFEK